MNAIISPILNETLTACIKRERAKGFRVAARLLMERADQEEREADELAEIGRHEREAVKELDHGRRYLRALREKEMTW